MIDKLYVENLALEVTRKCNLKCEHCLRGNAQNKSMTADVIRAVCQNISSVGTLTIAGGEPSLAIDILTMLCDEIRCSNISIGNIYLVTNGKRLSEPLLKCFDDLYSLCWDNEVSGFAVSNDRYHQRARGFHRSTYDYTELLYALDDDYYSASMPDEIIYEHTSNDRPMGILARGRAANWGDRDEPYLDCLKLDDLDNPTEIKGEMYVCYDGTVVGDVNMCYLDMKKYARGSVLDFDNLLVNLKQSTIDNYNWCRKNCKHVDSCDQYSDSVLEQMHNINERSQVNGM